MVTGTEFTLDQLNEIKEGEKAGLDVSIYARKEFYAIQMRQIRLGMMQGFPVQVYASTAYDWFQMEEILHGMKSGVNYRLYAYPKVSYDRMRQIRKGLEKGIDLSPYLQLDADILRELRKALQARVNIVEFIKQGYDAEQLKQIRKALLKGVDLKPYLLKELLGDSIREIAKGLERGLDVSFYAGIELGWQQMREIRLGLEQRLDVSIYANPMYSWKQMKEIRLGLEAGINVSEYCSLMYTAREMKKKRLQLQDDTLQKVLNPMPKEEVCGNFCITLEKDEMEAYIMLRNAEVKVSKEEILKALQEGGITQGILEKSIELLAAGKGGERPVQIAKGAEPITGKDGWYEYFFRTELSRKPKLLEDGSVDYQNIEWFDVVKNGQKIAYYHEAECGINGYTVTGKTLLAKKGKEQNALAGKGFILMPDKKTYVAVMTGKIELRKHKIEITKILLLDEVTLSTGNVNFDGSVYIKGHVGSQTVIKATEDIVVDGFVESACLECGGTIILRKGVNGAGEGYIRAEESIYGNFFEAIPVYSGQDIHANYCLNCNLYAEGEILIAGKKGMLAGGIIYALKGVKAHNVGNRAGIPTCLRLGKNDDIQKKWQETEDSIQEVSKELSILGNAYTDFQRKYPVEIRNTMEMYLEIENAIYTKEKELEKLYELKTKLEDKMAGIAEAKALIKGNLYEGTVMEINGQSWTARDLYNVTVRMSNGRIIVYTN